MKLFVFFLTASVVYAIKQIPFISKPEKESDLEFYIKGGQYAKEDDDPWQAQVFLSQGINESLCGGSIISTTWVVTSALCLGILTPTPVVVDYGSIRLNGGTVVNVTRIIKHEDVNWVTGDSDIALFKNRSNEIGFVHAQKIGLPQQDFGLGVGRIVNISGFGWTDNYGPYSKNLKYGSAKVLSEKECKEGFPQLTEKQFCAGDFGLGTTDFCYGDYGGPAANWGILYGIQSTHKNRYWCGLPKQPGVYTNVSQFVDWIKETITNNSDNNELRKLTSLN